MSSLSRRSRLLLICVWVCIVVIVSANVLSGLYRKHELSLGVVASALLSHLKADLLHPLGAFPRLTATLFVFASLAAMLAPELFPSPLPFVFEAFDNVDWAAAMKIIWRCGGFLQCVEVFSMLAPEWVGSPRQ